MARIRVSTTIDAPPRAVWAAIEDVTTHVRWMQDAEAIRLTSKKTKGVGTTLECDTRVGPLMVTDELEVTGWLPRKSMTVAHRGAVSGEGTFVLRRARGGRTHFTWTERLHFPPWLGGPVGALVAKPILKRIWRKNLGQLRAIVEDG